MKNSFSKEQLDAVDEALNGLIEKGLVNITGVNENGELLYELSDKARKIFE
jgi:hypothetical protein